MLTGVSNYSGIISREELGLGEQDYNDFIEEAIERAYLSLRKVVPKATFDEARAALAANTADEAQLNLRWAEYWLTRYEIETAKSGLDVVSERAGNLQIRRDISGSTKMANRFINKARSFLAAAGFEWMEGGVFVAGVRGGDPIPGAKPWFDGEPY